MSDDFRDPDFPKSVDTVETHFVDGQFVVYDTRTEIMHYLNASAALIFELCDGTHTAPEIVSLLSDAYGLDSAPLQEVNSCLATLRTAGIVR